MPIRSHPTVPFAPVHRLIVIPERMIGINRNDCSRSIGTADRDGPERALLPDQTFPERSLPSTGHQ